MRYDLAAVLRCPACGEPLRLSKTGMRTCCQSADGPEWDGTVVRYDQAIPAHHAAEMRVRDNQAGGYLQHPKFGTQIDRIAKFLDGVRNRPPGVALDLGCGPGPTAAMLVDLDYDVVAVDFSLASLRLNAEATPRDKTLFVQSDLTRLQFTPESVSGLMMADFLQHLVDHEVQRAFLHAAFAGLVPNGWFYLSFFNVNLKHRVKGNIVGSFAGGAIPYRRLTPREVVAMLPQGIEVNEIVPMNVSHDAQTDRLFARLPFVQHIARMMAISGYKKR